MNNLCLKTFLLSITLAIALCTRLQCQSTDFCFCPEDFEDTYLCPFDYAQVGGFQITITKLQQVIIECSNLPIFNPKHLPNITLTKTNLLRLRFCPLPPQGFGEILQNLGVEDVSMVDVEYGNSVIGKDQFQQLRSLKYLKLSENILNNLEDGIFSNTPNLRGLELNNNHLTLLKPNLLHKLEFLELLNLADNQLETLPDDLFTKCRKLIVVVLRGNKLKHLPVNLFKNLHNLEELDLSDNQIETIHTLPLKSLKNLDLSYNKNLVLPEQFFSNLYRLEQIDLSGCNLTQLPNNMFKNCHELKMVALRRNNLKYFPQKFFDNLYNLEELDVASNQIESIPDLQSLTKLKIIKLENNNIQVLPAEIFGDLIRLEELYLQQNQIETIHSRIFFNNDELRIIDLSENRYSRSDEVLFKDTINIEEIDLSNNLITRIEDVVTLDNKPFLQKIDLTYNLIGAVSLVTLQGVSNVDVFLDHNNISIVRFDNIDLISSTYVSTIYLSDNPLTYDCHNYELFKHIESHNGHIFDIRSDLEMVPLATIYCPLTKCPEQCFCKWRPFDNSFIVDCANRKLSSVPPLLFNWTNFSQIEVHLQNNNLQTVDLTGYANVTKLFLSGNFIRELSCVPPKIQMLHLDHNNITRLNYDIIQALNTSSLRNLTLDHNPWICDCSTENLTSFIRNRFKQINYHHVICTNSTRRLVDLTRSVLCPDLTLLYLTLVASFLVLPSIFVAIFSVFKKNIKFWLFSKNLCLWWVSEEDLDKDKLFDAFVSYSHKDEAYIVETLVPRLESEGYKICLHFRDWVPGEMISTQIVTSIATSKRTIVVLSQNFLQSVWAKEEFKQAHAEGMSEGRVKIIMILLGEIDIEGLDQELRLYLRTNTYLKWGDSHFWEKLQYALPHRKLDV
ncbi:toll-like protein [Tribolium castaneum]|uniref:Toll-like protein n=1 Tax=Tribolium castaneum TaxID=7070 RepID=D6WCM2_TRICA|nr:PREDICTED: protein toll [Tribolium castaneum]EEZ99173.2 toll-like protein [Tribolium castaneum]|eukprot:XP_015832932.1 PREDICTED: protein toll [Tribolium castaneum]